MASEAARIGTRRRVAARRRPAKRTRATTRRRRRAGPRVWARRVVALGLIAAALAATYMLWLRDSGLVAVRDVTVVGLSSEESGAVRAELERAGKGMSTLHVRQDELRAAVRGEPTIASVSAEPDFPRGLEIRVEEREPVAILAIDGSDRPVAGDGTVLATMDASGLELPALDGAEISAGKVSGEALEQARVLGAAPGALRPLIATSGFDGGVVVELTDGIELRFGDSTDAAAKWSAAARVLADGGLGSLTYIDLAAPQRPAVGGATASPGSV